MIFWAVTDLRWCSTAFWLFLEVDTDIPIHLILRYTTHEPTYPVTWPERRGVPHKAIDPTFPPEWRAVDENYPGDHITHAFEIYFDTPPPAIWIIFTAVPIPWQPASHAGPFKLPLQEPVTYTTLDSQNWTPPPPAAWILGAWAEISDAQFVSPPTSIRNIHHAAGFANWIGPGDPPPIPNGQFIFWSYFMDPGKVEIHFRLSGWPLYPSHTRSYYIRFGTGIPTEAYRYESPTTTLLGPMDYVPTPNTWERLLLFWAPSCALSPTSALEILLMKQEAWGWNTVGLVFDPLDKWADEEENRFAFDLYTDDYNAWCYFDDTILQLVT